VTKVELFEDIRKRHFVQEQSIRGIAQQLHVHRRMVRQALESAVPPARKPPRREPLVLTHSFRRLIDQWLLSDRRAPRKQRHTARRIFKRLVKEHGFGGGESTVRKYVGRRKRELALSASAFIPLCHLPGEEAEVDFYEAEVEFPEGRRKVDLFCMRACYSGKEFHLALPCTTQQAFLEAHVMAFRYFGGVFERLRYDNLSDAVKKILRGRRREETDRFIALRSHYLFDSEFCRPGKEGAHEKGGVEQAQGRFRRTYLVPVPKVKGFEQLNELLTNGCLEDEGRTIEGRCRSIAEQWAQERPRLRGLPSKAFEVAEVSSPRVDEKGRVRVRTNWYSVPIGLVGRRVEVRLRTGWVEVLHSGRLVAAHERVYGRNEERLKLDHYLELLQHKPGALERCRPLQQARERGEWPGCYDQLWQKLKQRYGESGGTRQILEVLLLHRQVGSQAVHEAVEAALRYGCYEAAAVRLILRQAEQGPDAVVAPLPLGDLGDLERYGRPAGDTRAYDLLLGEGVAPQELSG
jgi:transposase